MIISNGSSQKPGSVRIFLPVPHGIHMPQLGQVLQQVNDLLAVGPVVGQLGMQIVEAFARVFALDRD